MENTEFAVPTGLQDFFISESNARLLGAVQQMSVDGEVENVMVTGSQGTGKSELVKQFAACYERPLATFEVGQLSDPMQIFGQMVIENDETLWKHSLFAEAIETPNAVIHLQELNRIENDKVLNALFSILDPTYRNIYIDEAKRNLTVAKGVTFFATLNQGFEYIGTMPLDVALGSRFGLKIKLAQIPLPVERLLVMQRFPNIQFKIDDLMSIVNDLRTNTEKPLNISTREVIAMAKLVNYGINFKEAIISGIDTTDEGVENVLFNLHALDRLESSNAADDYKVFSTIAN